ncbi:3-hydroxyacyl-CoA dehydrogenase NAD-binding domain-containing protein [Candidatus Uabimicrobium sp. HlEnr_7]|uniref:3-hydroxyacyl-CoA dehydrogenase/enoyl-CoA hydratase family protein n=1 Tax=Candidatus Uabimicrobium helgolandensis TaxID=3095367 RepID=UPI003556D709
MSPIKTINHVAVIGSGVMGGGIAAFFANQGITCDMYDIELDIAAANLKKLADPKAKIPLLYTPRLAKKITPRSNSDMAEHLHKADMVVEVVPEIQDLKDKMMAQIDASRKPDSMIVTNTSGLSVNRMIANVSDNMKKCFAGTHYFNPVRYLPLVEIIPAATTDSEMVAFLQSFFTQAGKKTIICRDTPNFVANRVGVYSLMKTLALMEKYNFDVETVDAITGPPIGNPKTATLRLCDLVGNDTTLHVAQNLYDNCPEDKERDLYKCPPILARMVEDKMLGQKSGKGFYRKEGRKILALDIKSWEYKPAKKIKLDEIKVARSYQKIEDRLYQMVKGDSPIHKFCREITLSTAAYAIDLVGEIAEDVLTIDNGMKWGFNREIGPIEALDAIGLDRSMEWMRAAGMSVPNLLQEVASTTGSFYKKSASSKSFFDIEKKSFVSAPKNNNAISIAALKHKGNILRENVSARLIDLEDGALLLEIDSRMVPTMNPIDEFVVSMMEQAFEEIAAKKFSCLVVSNQNANFCAGANIQLLLELCKEKKWDAIRDMSKAFQDANMRLHYASVPVVVAPHGMTLGGGMEVTLAGHKRVSAAELYGGLVEVGVGLLPGGAGNLLLIKQFINNMASQRPGPVVPTMKALELIAYGKVSSSAHDAMSKGFLNRDDIIVLDKDMQIQKAKEVALEMVDGFEAKKPQDLLLAGRGSFYVIEENLKGLLRAHQVPPHGAFIATKMAHVLTGGERANPATPISEDYFLELEREAFVELCSEPKSQERIVHMLKTKKPLLN